jgi:hypothetical protein
MQIRSNPAASPRDVDGVLDIVAGLNISLLGVAGSNHEFDGEIGLMVGDSVDIVALRDQIKAAYDDTQLVGEPDGLHLDYVLHAAGGLAAAVLRARRHHPGGVIKDIAIGVDKIAFRLKGTDLVRDAEGYPTHDGPGTPLEAHPVQIFFVVTPARNPDTGRRA